MDSDELFHRVVQILSRWSVKGEKILSNRTRLICPTPHVAPEAWLHALFAPLSGLQVDRMQKSLGTLLPDDFRQFLLRANGLQAFSYRVSVWGLRKTWQRHGDEVWQPFDLVSHNEEVDRPSGSPSELVYFGASDVGNTWCFFEFDGSSYRVGKTERHDFKPIAYWPEFGVWLLQEIESLEDLFDSDGRLISETAHERIM
jgi:hypothetical protein